MRVRTYHSWICLIITVLYFNTGLSYSKNNNNTILSRPKRKLPLLFNDFGVSQFVCGFGVPVDLDLETVTTGIVFKSQLPLPSKPSDLRNYTSHNIKGRGLNGESQDHTFIKQMRWNMYNALELWANSIGLNGRECVLKTLCEASQIPFNNETGDLWHEVVNILFVPFSSVDHVNHRSNNEYLRAAKFGLSINHNCDLIFKKCPKSLMHMFSNVF